MLNPILNPILYVPISRRLFAVSLFLQALKELLATSTESKKKNKPKKKKKAAGGGGDDDVAE